MTEYVVVRRWDRINDTIGCQNDACVEKQSHAQPSKWVKWHTDIYVNTAHAPKGPKAEDIPAIERALWKEASVYQQKHGQPQVHEQYALCHICLFWNVGWVVGEYMGFDGLRVLIDRMEDSRSSWLSVVDRATWKPAILGPFPLDLPTADVVQEAQHGGRLWRAR